MKNCIITKVLMCLAGLVLFVAQAGAGVVFSDDFEGDTIGLLPIISGSDIGNGWASSAQNRVLVAANPDSTSGSGNESAQVLEGAGGTLLANNIVGYLAGGAKSIDGLTISYDFYCASGGHDNDSVRSGLVGDLDSNRDSWMRNDRDKAILVDGTVQSQQNFGANVWQNWTATFTQTDIGVYDIAYTVTNLVTSATVTGVQSVTVNMDIFTDGMLRGIVVEVFEGNAGTNTFVGYIDNVTVVPEPATLMLLGLGAVLFRRRK